MYKAKSDNRSKDQLCLPFPNTGKRIQQIKNVGVSLKNTVMYLSSEVYIAT